MPLSTQKNLHVMGSHAGHFSKLLSVNAAITIIFFIKNLEKAQKQCPVQEIRGYCIVYFDKQGQFSLAK